MATLLDGALGSRAYNWGSAVAQTILTASQTTAVLGAGEWEITTDTDCYFLVTTGSTAAAAATGRFLAAGRSKLLQLGPQDKISVIRKTADGTLHILPVS